ncbi:MAG: 3'-5' exonuclease [Clostridiales bacterium]|nr:MAG: 3'-5' exonuclease [Clostridiales bacterium]
MYTKIIDLKDGDNITGYYLVKKSELRIATQSKKTYIDITLVDKTGEVNAKLWAADENDLIIFNPGSIVKINAKVKNWNEKLQLNINKYRNPAPEENIKVSDFVPSAPIPAQDLYDYMYETIKSFKDEELRLIVTSLVNDKKDKLMVYPAAKSFHHSVRSGLLYHIYRMLKLAKAMATVYENVNLDLLCAGVILHDLYKTEEMNISDVGLVTDYSPAGNMIGHISLGVSGIETKAKELHIDSEVVLLLKHMVLSHHYYPEYGSPVFPMFLEAELLHYIDVVDARVYDFTENYEKLNSGEISQPVFSLDRRRIYRPSFVKTKRDN